MRRLREAVGAALTTGEALELGLVTVAPDELDWADEVRLALEERASLSPDALTGMEANLRFGGTETMETRIFGRLSAWQNWIFVRPNVVGEAGALKVFGTGNKARFDWDRVRGLRCGPPSEDVDIDYNEKIPGNVDLAANKTLTRPRTMAAEFCAGGARPAGHARNRHLSRTAVSGAGGGRTTTT
jgi:hypothetical protein